MGISDKFKGLTQRAEDAAAAHKDQLHAAVQKAEQAADQRTGGQYHEQIRQAGDRADTMVDALKESDPPAAPAPAAPPPPAAPNG